mgnify:CR=1 FL=1
MKNRSLMKLFTQIFSFDIRIKSGRALKNGIAAGVIILILGFLSKFTGNSLLIGSFGASIFLLLAVPHSPFSQPRNLFIGHCLASLIGLVCFNVFSNGTLALAVSMCIVIMLMQIFDVSHPPAASNPIIIYLSSPDWVFILVPTLSGAFFLFTFAYFFHRWISKNEYPVVRN